MKENKYRDDEEVQKKKKKKKKSNQQRWRFHLFVEEGPYGAIPLDAFRADDDELRVPNGPILLKADDIRLVIPRRERGARTWVNHF